MIMMMMPLIFPVICYNFPAGLLLYWTTSNILMIVQQHFTNKNKDIGLDPETLATPVGGKTPKKSKGKSGSKAGGSGSRTTPGKSGGRASNISGGRAKTRKRK